MTKGDVVFRYGVKYPALYASKDDCASEEECNAFNCIQRGHQNSLETQPMFLALFMLAAVQVCAYALLNMLVEEFQCGLPISRHQVSQVPVVQHPVVAAALAVLYCTGRVIFMLGYKTGVPENRWYGGRLFAPAFVALLITNMKICGVWAAGLLA